MPDTLSIPRSLLEDLIFIAEDKTREFCGNELTPKAEDALKQARGLIVKRKSNPFLTIILTDIIELDESYLDLYFQALNDWNFDALSDLQIVIISQRKFGIKAIQLAEKQNFQVDVVHSKCDFVGGYPIWDLMADIRLAWPHIIGKFVTFNHPEFIWGPGRLRRTIDFLKGQRSYLALGNLRRPGQYKQIVDQTSAEHGIKAISDQLLIAMCNGHTPQQSAGIFETLPSCWWMFWSAEQKAGFPVAFFEDVFFAHKGWLESWDFARHGGELPFQDIYDLVRVAIQSFLPKYKIEAKIARMDQATNKMIHLWHPKCWQSWQPEIRDYFLSNPARWQGTKFLDAKLWQELIDLRKNMPKNVTPVNTLRSAPNGTVSRYGASFTAWLEKGGAERVRKFYEQNGRDQWT